MKRIRGVARWVGLPPVTVMHVSILQVLSNTPLRSVRQQPYCTQNQVKVLVTQHRYFVPAVKITRLMTSVQTCVEQFPEFAFKIQVLTSGSVFMRSESSVQELPPSLIRHSTIIVHYN